MCSFGCSMETTHSRSILPQSCSPSTPPRAILWLPGALTDRHHNRAGKLYICIHRRSCAAVRWKARSRAEQGDSTDKTGRRRLVPGWSHKNGMECGSVHSLVCTISSATKSAPHGAAECMAMAWRAGAVIHMRALQSLA